MIPISNELESGHMQRLCAAADDLNPIAVRQILAEECSEVSRVAALVSVVRGRLLAKYTRDVHKMIDLLLERPFLSEENQNKALDVAVQAGHYEYLESFGQAPFLIPHRDKALENAAWNGDLESVKRLLASGEISKEGRGKAVRKAALNGRLGIVKILLASGEISIEDRGQASINAVYCDSLDVVNTLLANGEIPEADAGVALISAAGRGCYRMVVALLSNENCPISQQDRGKAVIRAASAMGSRCVIDALFEKGAILDEQYEEAITLAHNWFKQILIDWRDYHHSDAYYYSIMVIK